MPNTSDRHNRTHLAAVSDTSGMATAAGACGRCCTFARAEHPGRYAGPAPPNPHRPPAAPRVSLIRAKIFIGKLQEGQDSHLSYFAQSPNSGPITTRFRGRRKVAGKRARASRQETISRSTIGNCQSR